VQGDLLSQHQYVVKTCACVPLDWWDQINCRRMREPVLMWSRNLEIRGTFPLVGKTCAKKTHELHIDQCEDCFDWRIISLYWDESSVLLCMLLYYCSVYVHPCVFTFVCVYVVCLCVCVWWMGFCHLGSHHATIAAVKRVACKTFLHE